MELFCGLITHKLITVETLAFTVRQHDLDKVGIHYGAHQTGKQHGPSNH